MKHYMFVVPALSCGGAERVVTVLASELAKTDKVTILVYFRVKHEYARNEKINVVYMTDAEADYDGLNYYHRLSNIRKIVRKANPDYVIPFLSHVCMQVRVALLGTRYPVLQTVRNNPATLPASPLVRKLRDCFIRFSCKTIVQNSRQKEYFSKSLWHKIHVMPNPVRTDLLDLERSHPRQDRWTVISAGRLNEQKNYPLIIDAFAHSPQIREACQLLIYGEGELHSELQHRIDSLGLAESIRLMGRSEDMPSVYASADMFVMTSNFEGMPNALMEAMAAGLPCISTDCPTGPSDLIRSMENGILIEVNNRQQLEEAILYFVQHEQDALAMGRSARKTISEHYTPEMIAKTFISICGE